MELKTFLYTDFAEYPEKNRFFKEFSVNSVFSVYKRIIHLVMRRYSRINNHFQLIMFSRRLKYG